MGIKNKIEEKESIVRQVQKELSILYQALYSLGEIPLDKPIRNGWYKRLIMRSDISRRKDADVFREWPTLCYLASVEWAG